MQKEPRGSFLLRYTIHMNKFIVGILTAGLLVPAVSLAYTDCRDTDNGCTMDQLLSLSQSSILTQQDKISVLQQLIGKLSTLLVTLAAQKSPAQAGPSG